MRSGMAVILSDIAASTLGIVLVLYLLLQSLVHSPEPGRAQSGTLPDAPLDSYLEVVTAPALTPDDMVSALYRRGRGRDQGGHPAFHLIEAYPDRVVFLRSSGDGAVSPVGRLSRAELVSGQGLGVQMPRSQDPAAPDIVFIFSNQLLNVLLKQETALRDNTLFINVPAALIERRKDGVLQWAPEFLGLFADHPDYQGFRRNLAGLLRGDREAGASLHDVPVQGSSAGGGRSVQSGLSLLDRLSLWGERFFIALLVFLSGLLVWRVGL